MPSKGLMGWGAIILAVLIALGELMTWPGWTSYVWAVLALLWGIMWLSRGE